MAKAEKEGGRGGNKRCPLERRFKALGYRGGAAPRSCGLRRLKGHLGGFERRGGRVRRPGAVIIADSDFL